MLSSAISFGGTELGFGGFLFAVLGRRGGFEGEQQAGGDGGDVVDGGEEGGLVGFRGLGEAADLANELERGRANFIRGDRGIEVEKRADVAAHADILTTGLRRKALGGMDRVCVPCCPLCGSPG